MESFNLTNYAMSIIQELENANQGQAQHSEQIDIVANCMNKLRGLNNMIVYTPIEDRSYNRKIQHALRMQRSRNSRGTNTISYPRRSYHYDDISYRNQYDEEIRNILMDSSILFQPSQAEEYNNQYIEIPLPFWFDRNPFNGGNHMNLFTGLMNLIQSVVPVLNQSNVPVHISTEDFDKILEQRFVDYKKNKNIDSLTKTCTICTVDFIDDDNIKILKCNHYFHSACIKEWLTKYHFTCPVCRAEVSDKHIADIHEQNQESDNEWEDTTDDNETTTMEEVE